MANKTTLNFVKEKDTPGAVRYQEADDKGSKADRTVAKIGTLYVRKETFSGGTVPDKLKVTLDW